MRAKILSLISGTAFAILAVLGVTPASSQEVFRIGIVASLSGGFAAAAKEAIEGANAWVANAGIEGKTVEFEILDDETNPVNATNAFRRLVSDPEISLVYLFVPSNSALAIKAVASEFKVPIISGGGAEALGVPAEPYLFKVNPGNRDYMTVICQYAGRKDFKRLAILTAADAYGQFDEAAAGEICPEYGVEIVAKEKFGVEDTNFIAQATRIKSVNPDLIYNGATARTGILSYQQIKQLEIAAPLVVQAPVASFYEAIGGREAAEGLLMPIQLGAFGAEIGGDTARYYKELEAAVGHAPVYFNIFGYDVGLITQAAVENSDGTREGIRDALENLQKLPAINGPVSYTPDNHTGQNYESLTMGVLIGGELTIAE